ncbi:MAG TPA: hypothetical protein VG457_05445 [Planctomycetota bacterium]|jgi:hypothetical protein|nr:hypothetical protein [Planctomycetota bacterium]
MRITTKGIGAHDQDLELRRLTLLVGPNGSGKSKVAEAIRMVALGYVPALGKRPVDLAALMHGESMSVELSLDGGRTIRRGLELREAGYTASCEASWMRQGKPGEVSKAITKLFGDEEIDVAECLDIRQLLTATPNQRSARMEPLLKAGTRSAEDIAGDVARLIVMRLAETTEDRMPADYRDALPMVPDKQKEILFEQADMLKTKILEAGIQGAITWANEEKRNASEGLKRKNAAAEELRKRAAQVPEPDERDIIRLEGEQKKLHQELGAARQRRSDYESKAQILTALQEQLEAVQEHAQRTQQQAVDAEAVHGKAAADMRERSDKVLEQMSSLKLAPEEPDTKAQKLELEARDLVSEADGIDLTPIPDISKDMRKLGDLKARLELIEMSEWTEVLGVAQEIEDASATKGVKTIMAKPIKRLRELAHKGMGEDPQALRHELDLQRKKFHQAEQDMKAATASREKESQQRLALTKKADAKVAEAVQIRAEISQRRRAALQDFEAKRTQLSLERQKFEKALETHKKALKTARSEKASVDRHLASIRDRLQGAGELPEVPPDPAAIESKLRQAGDELGKLIAARATHTEIHAVLDEIEAAKAGAVVFAGIEWALQRQREIEISNAGGPLMRTMSEFLKGAGRKETPFIRASQGSCAIGWKAEDGREVRIEALSGGEWCLFAAALTSAVILCRKSVVKILLVEAGETDARTLKQLLAGIAAVDGPAEALHAIVMSPRAPEVLDQAWTVIRTLEAKEATANAAA